MKPKSNQIPTEIDPIDSREPFNGETEICKYCGFPESYCDCPNYDSEGNEL